MADEPDDYTDLGDDFHHVIEQDGALSAGILKEKLLELQEQHDAELSDHIRKAVNCV